MREFTGLAYTMAAGNPAMEICKLERQKTGAQPRAEHLGRLHEALTA